MEIPDASIKPLQAEPPREAPFDHAVLDSFGVSPQLAARYAKSGWLVRLAHGTTLSRTTTSAPAGDESGYAGPEAGDSMTIRTPIPRTSGHSDSTLIRTLIPRASGHFHGRQLRRIYSLPSTSFRSEEVVVERLSMRKIREVLRLKFDGGLSVRKIARSLCSRPCQRRRLPLSFCRQRAQLALFVVRCRVGAATVPAGPRRLPASSGLYPIGHGCMPNCAAPG